MCTLQVLTSRWLLWGNAVPLKEKCVEYICTDDSWKAPHIAAKLPALPIGKQSHRFTVLHRDSLMRARLLTLTPLCSSPEVIERVMLYLHRTERLTLEALEFFKAFPVETLFLSNIRVRLTYACSQAHP
jgi:hypothetical protein